MSILGSILSKIFHPAAAAGPAPEPGSASASNAGQASASAPTPSDTETADAGTTANAAPAQPVDVAAILNDLAAKNPQKLNWQSSIVDLMKLLDLDSSLQSRTELAHELHYSGDTNDSAAMNIWLHKQVMQKLAENGGKVPADLKS